jgi:hypothetical protein
MIVRVWFLKTSNVKESRMQTPLDILKAADELLSDKSRWTQRANARDNESRECAVLVGHSFCLNGALIRVTEDRYHTGNVLLYKAAHVIRDANDIRTTISVWNDDPNRTFEEVKAALQKAIEYAEKMP